MVQSKAKTPAAYLKELPPERRKVIAAVRKVIKDNLPAGYVEAMNYGMIVYQIPFSTYPETYNDQPLCYAGLAAQKNNYAVYVMDGSEAVREKVEAAYAAMGKKPDMGKCCLRFKKLEDLPLETVGELIAKTSVAEFIKQYEASRAKPRKR